MSESTGEQAAQAVSGSPLAPVGTTERLLGIDAARGFALLGIFLVNVLFQMGPVGPASAPVPPEGSGSLDAAGWWFIRCMFMSKTYPLFSLLFGIGLAIQLERARKRDRGVAWLHVRRLSLLLLFGVVHAFFIWYGDILLQYATIGLIAGIWLVRLPRWGLIGVGSGLVLLATAQAMVMVSVAPMDGASSTEQGTADVAAESPGESGGDDDSEERDAVEALVERLKGGEQLDPTTQAWVDAEMQAFGEGGFGDASLMRAINYMGYQFYSLFFGMHAQILGMMLLGAGLYKFGLFDERGEKLRRAILAMFPIAIGVSIVLAILTGHEGEMNPLYWGLMTPSGALHAIGYLGLFAVLARVSAVKAPIGWLAATGRLSFTNYIAQSLIATGIAHWWGGAMFGELSPIEMYGVAVGVYLCQIAFSVFWLEAFKMGPLEWFWRSLTYFRLQKIRREQSA